MSVKRCVVDTNVLVSAALSTQSTPHQAVAEILEHAILLASVDTFNEFASVLHRPKLARFLRDADRDEYLSLIQARSHFVKVREHIELCRDPDDDKFLELAVSGQASIIITGDADLLDLDAFRGIPIVTPAEYVGKHRVEE